MIIAHAGFSPNPINSPVRNLSTALTTIIGQQFTVYGDAVDTNDGQASFSFQWQVLNPRSGQTANLSPLNEAVSALKNFSGTWGDIRCFLIATNTSTLETSETNPLLAPESAFITLNLQSDNKRLTLPAVGSRQWWQAHDELTNTVEDLTIGESISSASVNGSGDLIIELESGETINAGNVQGTAGADGTDGTDGDSAYEIAVSNGFTGSETEWLDSLNGTDGTDGDSAYEIAVSNGFTGSETEWLDSLNGTDGTDGNDGAPGVSTRRFAFTSDVYHWYDDASNTVQTGFNPAKVIFVSGAFKAEHSDLAVFQLNVSAKDAGAVGNSVQFQLFTCSEAEWQANSNINFTSLTATLNASSTTANAPANATAMGNITVTTGALFGVAMFAPTLGIVHGLSITLLAEET
jgi:hypothetical protein